MSQIRNDILFGLSLMPVRDVNNAVPGIVAVTVKKDRRRKDVAVITGFRDTPIPRCKFQQGFFVDCAAMTRAAKAYRKLIEDRDNDADQIVLMSHVVSEAYKWWKSKRPLTPTARGGWTKEEHHKNPIVNCVGPWENRLAKAVSELYKVIEEKDNGTRRVKP